MKNWQKAKGFCDQPWNFTYFAHEFDQICAANVNSNTDGHGKFRNDHRKFREKKIAKSMGTLNNLIAGP